jgi:hypothetical protein
VVLGAAWISDADVPGEHEELTLVLPHINSRDSLHDLALASAKAGMTQAFMNITPRIDLFDFCFDNKLEPALLRRGIFKHIFLTSPAAASHLYGSAKAAYQEQSHMHALRFLLSSSTSYFIAIKRYHGSPFSALAGEDSIALGLTLNMTEQVDTGVYWATVKSSLEDEMPQDVVEYVVGKYLFGFEYS